MIQLVALLALVTVVVSLGSLAIPTYADSLKLPSLSDDNVVGMNVYTNYQSDNRYTVNIEVQYQVNSPLEVPNVITYFSIDGTQIFTIPVQEEFITKNTPIVAGEEPELTAEEIEKIAQEARHDKIKQKIEAETTQFFEDFTTCLELFKEEDSVKYEAWLRTAGLEDFIFPDNPPTKSNLSSNEQLIKQKHQECIHMRAYQDFGPWEANKIIDGHELGKSLDESDSPHTVDITAEDILAEAQRAEEQKRHYINPYKDFTGENRGNPYSGESKADFCQRVNWTIDVDGEHCPIKDKIELDLKSSTLEEQQRIAQETQCKAFLPPTDAAHYKDAWEKRPAFLSHCEFVETERKDPSYLTIHPITGEPNNPPTVSITVKQLD